MDLAKTFTTSAQTCPTIMRFQMQLRSRLTIHRLHYLEKVQLSHLAIDGKHWTKRTNFKLKVIQKNHKTI